VTNPLVSIVIPTYQHAQWLREAVTSVLTQTEQRIEAIVVDDGSTDGTRALMRQAFDAPNERLQLLYQNHSGPSVARNAGLDAARGEFVMFLDADDVIAPGKIARQLAAFDDDIGWVLSDTRIENESTGRTTTASQQYRYDDKDLGGWILPLLKDGNFIPIMAPLVRRSLLGDHIRFRDDRVPEDWHFWCAVAAAGRVRYVPEVLGTYRHRKTGRSRLPKRARVIAPNVAAPLRLNLGCGTPSTRSWHPILGLVNLDKSMGWCFEDGLGDFVDGSVAGITVSHALMYVDEAQWPRVFAEFARVLRPGGVVRITEDDTAHEKSRRHGGWKGSDAAVAMTSPAIVRAHLARAGLTAVDVTRETTRFEDRSLCQSQHGAAPDVFFIEGVREMTVLFAPHSDDETLFAGFLTLRYRPHVVICYPSVGDYGDTAVRETESRSAMGILGGEPVEQWNGVDLEAQMRDLDARVHPSRVLAPHPAASHPDHVRVAAEARAVFSDRVLAYHTYNDKGKVRRGTPVDVEPVWVGQKLRALARYDSQIAHPRASVFLINDPTEYVE
jgi:hypothetical protein